MNHPQATDPRGHFKVFTKGRAALLSALAVGFLARLAQAALWAHPSRVHEGQPILASVDGYYYLYLAREGDWTSLLAGLLATTSALTGLSLDWSGVLLPVLLGPLIAVPMWYLGRELMGPWCGWTAAVATTLSPFYLLRTSAGRPDTDLLNVVFVLALAYWCLKERWWAATATWALFLWWWDQTPTAVTFAFFVPLTVAIFHRGLQRMLQSPIVGVGYLWLFVGTLLIALLLDQGLDQAKYTVEASTNSWPPPNVIEQTGATWARLVPGTLGIGGLLIAAGGAWYLAYYARWRLAYLAFPAAVGLLSFSAERYVMFLIPLLALCAGALVQQAREWRGLAGLATATAVVAPLLLTLTPPPLPRSADQIEALKWLQNTPEDAVVWTDWGHGHLVRWYGHREPMLDGAHRTGKGLYLVSRPLAQDDGYFAAAWMQRVASVHSEHVDLSRVNVQSIDTGLRKIRWGERQNAFPGAPPVYVLVDWDKIRTSWWKHGTWSWQTRSHREAGSWLRDTVAVRLLMKPRVEGFRIRFLNDSVRVWEVRL